jgi:hypothetical protein
MTGVLIGKREKTYGEKIILRRIRDWSDESASQETTKIASSQQKPGERCRTDSP